MAFVPGDDDEIIIRRVNDSGSVEVDTTNSLLANLLGYIAPNTIADQPTKNLYNSLAKPPGGLTC